ncbi:MAG: hypothetical protein LBG15_07855 [Dysgonamonadaceae bacterium]|jgi:hypothetical protein|nr:hypothetical protein [Dysgonamonadaceae bacterium]
MNNNSQYITQSWEWCKDYRSRMGKESYEAYVNKVYTLLLNMRPNTYFSIGKNVSPENLDLFIKICCMFIQEQFLSDRCRDYHHTFSPDYREIRCVSLHFSKLNSNKSNTVTI